jgi:hypothetical protein
MIGRKKGTARAEKIDTLRNTAADPAKSEYIRA